MRVGLSGWVLGCVMVCAAAGQTPASGSQTQQKQLTIGEKIAASKNLLDINTATAADLKALPGMGDAYVARVVAGRPYTAKNQLVTRGVLSAVEYAKIKELVIAHRAK